MAGKRRDPDATRARILKAATGEFARRGLAGARGDTIARLAKSSERMLYYYYGSKQGLYRAVLESTYLSLARAERELFIDHLPPLEALDEFCRFVWRYYLEHPEFIGLVNSENLLQARHLQKSPQLGELVTPVIAMLSALVRRGVDGGQFRADVDPVELYIAIAAQGYFYLSNQHTLSAVLGRDLRDPRHLESHWQASVQIVRRFIER